MHKIYKILIPLLLSSNFAIASISGIVFQDLPVHQQILNTYGIKDANELGIKEITVTAYPSKLSTITDENGTWSLNTSEDSRIEFSNIPDYLKESPSNDNNHSSVQFIKNSSHNVTFGLYNPDDFSDTATPSYITSIRLDGSPIGNSMQSIQTTQYNSTGLNANYKNDLNIQGIGETPQDKITVEDIGSVWGAAYQKNKKRLFLASMIQRHIGFKNSPSDIYVVKYQNNIAENLLGSFSLQGKIPNNGGPSIDLGTIKRVGGADYTLDPDPLKPNRDLDAYAKVGKVSYGGMDIEYTKNKLWIINLKQQAIISVDISGEFSSLDNATTNQYLIKNLPNVPMCNNGEIRPWAMKVHKNKGYIGLICDANISQSRDDLTAYILSFSLNHPEDGFNEEINFPLNYNRQWKNWEAWRNEFFPAVHPNVLARKFFPQPILSDIEFDKKDNMYITFLDRYALQLGYTQLKAYSGSTQIEEADSFGELLKICYNNLYEVEGTGNCLQSNYSDLNITEFFNDLGGDGNKESSLGSLALLKGSNQLLHTTLSPHKEGINIPGEKPYWYTMGTHTLNLNNGQIDNWYANIYTAENGLGYKGNHLGDIELITPQPPSEIGDRIWNDKNKNGIQDVNESGIPDIKVQLICNNTIVGSVKTNSSGNYIFSNDTTKPSSQNFQYNITELKENTNDCFVRIPNTSGANKQNMLLNYTLTSPSLGEGNNSTLNDSNAIKNGENSDLSIQATDIPIAGSNNHSFDIGFQLSTTLTLGDRVWFDSNRNGIQDNNELGVNGITVSLYNNNNCSGVAFTSTTTSNDGNYLFSNLLAGNYCIAFTNLPTNHKISLSNQGTDNTKDSNANATAQIPNINLTANNNSQDMGIFSVPVIIPPIIPPVTPPLNRYTLGDRVWLDSNRNGIQDANESGMNGITVTLYNNNNCSGTGLTSSTTSNDGNYLFNNLLAGNYCIAFTNLPTDHNLSLSNQGIDNTKDSNANRQGIITGINLTANDNSQDMGIFDIQDNPSPTVVLAATTCNEMRLTDNTQAANQSSAITTIDVLANDTGSKLNQQIKFLSLIDGKQLWKNQETTITSVTTLDTLTVASEGTWRVVNNKVTFTALQSFNGQIPTPIYYIIEGGSDCTLNTQYSNVASISITTACTCPSYVTKSVSTYYNVFSILFLIIMTYSISLYGIKEEL